MALSEDITIYFDTDVFGVIGYYQGVIDGATGDILSGTEYEVILDTPYETTMVMEGTQPSCLLSTSDADNMTIDENIVIEGTNYYIRQKEPDGTGITTLFLEEA